MYACVYTCNGNPKKWDITKNFLLEKCTSDALTLKIKEQPIQFTTE